MSNRYSLWSEWIYISTLFIEYNIYQIKIAHDFHVTKLYKGEVYTAHDTTELCECRYQGN